MSLRPRLLALAAATAAALAGLAPSASAGPLVASAPGCDNGDTRQVFLRYLDPMSYFDVPGADFEAGADGWSLSGGAAVVDGASADLTGPGSRALALPAGAAATSPTVCVGLLEPTARFMVRRTGGSLLSTLRVEVLFEDAAGGVHRLPIGVTGGTGAFAPSLPMALVVNLLPLLPGEHTPVALRFVPQGGAWQIDDLHVDPGHKP